MASKLSGALMAISESIFLLMVISLAFRIAANLLHVVPFSLSAAFTLMSHKARTSLFSVLRCLYALLSAFNRASLAARKFLDLRFCIPFARLIIFFLLLLAVTPRLILICLKLLMYADLRVYHQQLLINYLLITLPSLLFTPANPESVLLFLVVFPLSLELKWPCPEVL